MDSPCYTMATTLMVRVNERSHRVLQELAKQQSTTMADVIDAAVEVYRRRRFLEDLNADFAALQQNAPEWKHELEERAKWDATVGDSKEFT